MRRLHLTLLVSLPLAAGLPSAAFGKDIKKFR